jgi:cytochrome P450 family 144
MVRHDKHRRASRLRQKVTGPQKDIAMESALKAEFLLDPGIIDQPCAFYKRLVEEAPVWQVPGTDIVVVSSYAAVTEAVGRVDDFSSNLVALLYRRDDGTPAVHPFEPGIQALATADPPSHSIHRKKVFPELVARRMAALRGDIEHLALGNVQQALNRSPIEAMGDVANAIPIRVVSKLIGFENEDSDRLLAAAFDSTGMLGATEPLSELLERTQRTEGVVFWIADQLQAVVDGAEAEGLLGLIGAAVADGDLDLGEGLTIMATLLSAGGESTTGLLGNALYILATKPDLQARIRDDYALINPFIEEALRLESPFRHHLRHATRTTELRGVTIPAGATMLLMWGAANRDPAQFDQPDEIVLDRPAPRHHLGFGRGIHLCVGAALARLEAEVILTQFLRLTDQFSLDRSHPPERVNSLMVRRFSSLPLIAQAV